MAEIDEIRKRALTRSPARATPEDIREAFADRRFLLNLLDQVVRDHAEEIRSIERDFREHMRSARG